MSSLSGHLFPEFLWVHSRFTREAALVCSRVTLLCVHPCPVPGPVVHLGDTGGPDVHRTECAFSKHLSPLSLKGSFQWIPRISFSLLKEQSPNFIFSSCPITSGVHLKSTWSSSFANMGSWGTYLKIKKHPRQWSPVFLSVWPFGRLNSSPWGLGLEIQDSLRAPLPVHQQGDRHPLKKHGRGSVHFRELFLSCFPPCASNSSVSFLP